MPVVVVLVLYATCAGAAGLVLGQSLKAGFSAAQLVPRLALLAICIVAYFIGPRVYGLEYEDAFVHQAASLWRSSHWLEAHDGYFVTVCKAGSAAECVVSGSFGTQLIGLSTLLSGLRLVGMHGPQSVNIVSAIAGAISLQIVLSMLAVYVSNWLSRAIAIALICSATSFYIISGSGFAEPLFVLFLMTYLSTYIALSESSGHGRLTAARWILLVSSGALMVLCKKEGVLLVILLPLHDAAWTWLKVGKSPSVRFPRYALALVSIGLLLFALTEVRILEAAERHGADIGEPAFALEYILRLAPPFARGALMPEYFGILGWSTLLAAPVALCTLDRSMSRLLTVLLAFFVLYVLHARHDAFVHGASVKPEEMVRYLYVMAPMSAIFVALVVDRLLRHSRIAPASGLNRTAPWMTAVIALLAFALVSENLSFRREEMAADEHENRTRLLRPHSPTANGVIYISPNSVALAALLGVNGQIVDSAVADDKRVMDWLRARQNVGAVLIVDPAICERPAAAASSTACEFLVDVDRRK